MVQVKTQYLIEKDRTLYLQVTVTDWLKPLRLDWQRFGPPHLLLWNHLDPVSWNLDRTKYIRCVYIYSVLTFSFLCLYCGCLHNTVRGKAKLSSPAQKPTESTVDGTPVSVSSPVSSPLSSTPLKREQESLLSVISSCLWEENVLDEVQIRPLHLMDGMKIIFNCNSHHQKMFSIIIITGWSSCTLLQLQVKAKLRGQNKCPVWRHCRTARRWPTRPAGSGSWRKFSVRQWRSSSTKVRLDTAANTGRLKFVHFNRKWTI